MDLTLQSILLKKVSAPLKTPFKTHLQEVAEREAILVQVKNSNGQTGYGECTAFSTPWYTEETVTGCFFVLQHVVIPLLQNRTFSHPSEVVTALAAVKGNRMAKAAVETAVWDLYAKTRNMPLWQLVGGTKRSIPAGVVIATDSGNLASAVEKAAASGYVRAKLKINRQTDLELLQSVIKGRPDMLFYADANGAFSKESFGDLLRFDKCGFKLIEQPFGESEWGLHACAKQEMKTAICLDESIASYEDAERMVELRAGDIAVLKMSRLGGWHETLKVYELFRQHSIGMWVGGMIEFGISKAHNLALASLPAIELPGDFSASRHFWEKDFITPEITVEQGHIFLSSKPGIGCEVLF